MNFVLAQVCISSVLVLAEEPQRPPFVREFLYDLFAAHEHVVTAPGADVKRIPYRLFVPPTASKKKPVPLVVWLHGGNELGVDNMKQLRWLELMMISRRPEATKFFVLAVQCVPEYARWYDKPGAQGKLPDMCECTYEIVQALLAHHPIDRSRIYLIGVSSGGAGCWEMAMRSPFPIAAIAPLSTGGAVDRENLTRLRQTPIWAFHPKTEVASLKQVRELVQIVNQMGGNATLTETVGNTHDSWTEAILVHGVMNWLLDQHLAEKHSWSLAVLKSWQQDLNKLSKRLKWWQALLQILVVITLAWAVCSGYRGLRRFFVAARPRDRLNKNRLSEVQGARNGS